MTHDVANAIVSLATKLSKQDDLDFINRATKNHYVLSMDIYYRDGHRIKKHLCLGSKSFYNVDGQVFVPVDNILSPKYFINITKNEKIMVPLLVKHFTQTETEIKSFFGWIRACISIPVLDVYSFNTNLTYVKSFTKVEIWDYNTNEDIENIVRSCIAYISCVENKTM